MTDVDYWATERCAPIREWLLSKGFIRDGGLLCTSWSTRIGIDSTELMFWPHAHGCEAIIRHHASWTLSIGTCETLEDVQRTCEAIRLINGFNGPEDYYAVTAQVL